MFLIAPRNIQRHARAGRVRVVQGELCASKQFARRIRVIRECRDAGDRIHVEAHLGNMEAGANGAGELLREQRRSLERARPRYHDELMGRESRDEVRRAHVLPPLREDVSDIVNGSSPLRKLEVASQTVPLGATRGSEPLSPTRWA